MSTAVKEETTSEKNVVVKEEESAVLTSTTTTQEDEDTTTVASPGPVIISKTPVKGSAEAETVEERVRRVSISEKSEETQRQHSVHGDLTPEELMTYLGQSAKKNVTKKKTAKVAKGIATGKITAGDIEKSGEKKVEKFALDFMTALIPTPTVMGDLLSVDYAADSLKKTPKHGRMSLGEGAQATVSLHRELRGHVFQRRVSVTARKCSVADCTTYHYRPAEVCYAHDQVHDKLYGQFLAKMNMRDITKVRQDDTKDKENEAKSTEPTTTATLPATKEEAKEVKEEKEVQEGGEEEAPKVADMPGIDDQDVPSPSAASNTTNTKPATPTKPAPNKTAPPPSTTIKSPQVLLQEQVQLRRQMVYHAETLSMPSELIARLSKKAQDSLQEITKDNDTLTLPATITSDASELAQLYHQFQVLDGDKDGILSPADVLNHLRSIDIDWLVSQQVKPPAEVLRVAESWLRASHPQQVARWHFADYVIAVDNHRALERNFHQTTTKKSKKIAGEETEAAEKEEDEEEEEDESEESKGLLYGSLSELLRTAFWDLRMIVLLRPINHPNTAFVTDAIQKTMTDDKETVEEKPAEANEADKEKEKVNEEGTKRVWEGHMLKRGYFFANERLNAFRYRYFKVIGLELVYYRETWVAPPKTANKPATTSTENNTSSTSSNNNPEKTTAAEEEDATTQGTAPEATADETIMVTEVDDAEAENAASSPANQTNTMEEIAIHSNVNTNKPIQNNDDTNMSSATTPTAGTSAAAEGAGKPVLKRVLRGTIPLQEIAVIDFSPKTLLKNNRSLPYENNAELFAEQQYVVFKITLYNGTRYTLAAKHKPHKEEKSDKEEDKEPNLLDWTSYFYWWSEVSRRIVQWKDTWGSGRSQRITLRDWVNAGAVIAKIALIKEKKEKMTTTKALMSSAKYLYKAQSTPEKPVAKPAEKPAAKAVEKSAEKTEDVVETNDKKTDENPESSSDKPEEASEKKKEGEEEASATTDEAAGDKTEKEEATTKEEENKGEVEEERQSASTNKSMSESILSRISNAQAASAINHLTKMVGVQDEVGKVSKKDVNQGKKVVGKAVDKTTTATSAKTTSPSATAAAAASTAKKADTKDEKPATTASTKAKEATKKKEEEDEKEDDDELTITDRDRYYLQVVHLDEDQLDEAGGIVVLAVKSYYMSGYTLAHLDKQYTMSIGKTIATTLYYTFNVFQYAAAAQNRIDSNKFGVIWDSASNTRDCAVCHYVFPTFSLRRTKTKHHCRVCGRIVCHTCSSTKIFLEVTQNLERVCLSCIKNNGPPKDRVLLDQPRKTQGQLLQEHTHSTARKVVKKTLLGGDEDHDDNEDEEEEDQVGGEEETEDEK